MTSQGVAEPVCKPEAEIEMHCGSRVSVSGVVGVVVLV